MISDFQFMRFQKSYETMKEIFQLWY